MATTTFTGSKASHSTPYSIQRAFLFWPVSGLTGRVISAQIDVQLRIASTITNKNFHLCLFTDRIDKTNWQKYNAHMVYQYPSSSSYYYRESSYTWFSENYLCNQEIPISLTGNAGNVSKSFTVDIDSANGDVSLWNGKNVFLSFYETGGESSGLIWGTSQKAVLTLTTTTGTVRYAVNGSYVECEVYYGTGGSYVQVIPYYGTGGSYVELGG